MVYRWTRADGTTGTAIRTTDVDNEGATIVVELRNDLLTVELWNDFTAEPLCMQVKYWCDLVAPSGVECKTRRRGRCTPSESA